MNGLKTRIGNAFLWAAMQYRKPRFQKSRAWLDGRPRLKKAVAWGTIGFGVINGAVQVVSLPAFAGLWTRKHVMMKDDYAATADCRENVKRGKGCTVEEIRAVFRSMENDRDLCTAYGVGCIIERKMDASAPKHQ